VHHSGAAPWYSAPSMLRAQLTGRPRVALQPPRGLGHLSCVSNVLNTRGLFCACHIIRKASSPANSRDCLSDITASSRIGHPDERTVYGGHTPAVRLALAKKAAAFGSSAPPVPPHPSRHSPAATTLVISAVMAGQLVLVTGGSGFVGSYCLIKLLEAGYRVRTTVRSLKREADVRAMVKAGGVEAGM